MLIEINVTRTFHAEIALLDTRGMKFQQELVYEWKPNYCEKCQTIGHVCHNQLGPREQQGEQLKRRRETKKVTYEWRTKGLVIPEARHKEVVMNEVVTQEHT
ncbi:hypothetical protein A4A49_51349 [Nicotiana attenuata]|uniref:Zinc knuckle CX2CX4HX4C domain-containing protein n=1 Tax=Nicotiana attenuata TaxID=49451 RepID=A0A314L3X5_NICAT|nr:hypothetical protein A4A49_51349 [Nicotiana attenuata]